MLLLSIFLFVLGADAGSVKHNQPCSLANQTLASGTYQFKTDCDSVTFCNSSSICDLKNCRRDIFPFGYDQGADLPPMCKKGVTFCPDEASQCLSLLTVGSPCQFNRDDQCLGPPNYAELADTTGFGLNVNGSVCLNNVCMWANATEGETCVVQNTAYVAYTEDSEFANIVSRGNCKVGLYCDSASLTCMQTKLQGQSCSADKECLTYNCLASGVCGATANAPHKVGAWVYVVVVVLILGGIVGTLVGLYFIHRKERMVAHDKRAQYYTEQNNYRQTIHQLQQSTRDSMFVGDGSSPRSTLFGGRDDSGPAYRASGLRYSVADDASSSGESVVVQRRDEKERY